MLEYELTKNEEIEVQEYLLSIKNCPSLSYTELNNLLKNLTSENQQIFIEGFLRTVVNYAIKVYCELKEHFVFPYSITDFIQSGNEVLVRFVNEKKYDNYHDFIWAFNIALRRNIIKNHLPISGNIIDKYLEFLDKRDEFFKKYHRNPSDDEMINIYGYGKKGIGYLNNYMYQNQVLKKSLNEDLLTNGCDYIGNLVENLFLRDTLLEILKDLNLKKHYYDIIIKYFGLTTNEHDGDNIAMTPIEINETYNYNNTQRIYQIIRSVLEKIRYDEEAMQKLTKCKEIVF